MKLIAKSDSKHLFSDEETGVVVDASTNIVTDLGPVDALLASGDWLETEEEAESDNTLQELANAAVTTLDINVLSSNDRMYTIPKGVVSEAKRGLDWRKEHDRGGTKVGVNTARTLAKGGQIGIRKVRHIAKYFPRHEVDKKGKGYKPGEDGYPSAGRIAWALWGGDAAQRWASAIVERENKKENSISEFGAGDWTEDNAKNAPDFDSFWKTSEERPESAYEFFLRVRLDGSGIDRLYRVDPQGDVLIWDDCRWTDLGNIEHDIDTYDKALDDPYDDVAKVHVPADVETAAVVSGMLDGNPFGTIKVYDINPDEAQVMSKGMPELDWSLIDLQMSSEDYEEFSGDEVYDEFDDGLTAAGEGAGDGEYTEEERSEKAKRQVRDKLGKFAKSGSSVIIGGNPDYTGVIRSLNPDKDEVRVELEDGTMVNVPGNITQEQDTFEPIAQGNYPLNAVNMGGILGEPRTPIDRPDIQLPGTMPALTSTSVNTLVNDYKPFANDYRDSRNYQGQIPTASAYASQIKGSESYYEMVQKVAQSTYSKYGTNMANVSPLYNWLKKSPFESVKNALKPLSWYKPKRIDTDQKFGDTFFEKREPLAAAAKPKEEDKEKKNTPDMSDVPPMYMAIVADDDPQAVMDLISIVPASTKTSDPAAFRRKDGEWVEYNEILNDLQSPTPPPVVVLEDQVLADVMSQIDGNAVTASLTLKLTDDEIISAHITQSPIVRSIIAAGGLDRNRGNAEKLRRYWLYGKGALKIRWNTPGDWTRCVRQLSKYMGPRAKGYCSLRHKEATGVWPGSRFNVGKKNKTSISRSLELSTLPDEEFIIDKAIMSARAEDARSRVLTAGGGEQEMAHGSKFHIPLVIPEEIESGDGRVFKKEAISMRELPLPLLWQIKTGEGHDGSVVVGKIVKMERTEDGIGNAEGYFDKGAYGKEAERLVRNGFIRGVSADLDKFEASEEASEASDDKDADMKPSKINITKARVMAVTLVPKPAFQECTIKLASDDGEYEEEEVVPDGVYVEDVDETDAPALVACGMVASSIPLTPPSDWFQDPKLKEATPLTVTDDGQVFGHIAAWHVDHIGMSFGTKPPRSRSKYAYFHTGVLRTEDGTDVPVGQLTLAGGHAPLDVDAVTAAKHYDDTASAIADVHAGEDSYGIWVAGALRPNATPEQIRALRASAPSGDWRPIKGKLELVAVCQVNVPGFPTARARVASGQVMALVAAGANMMARMKHDPIREFDERLSRLEEAEKQPIVAAAEEARAKFQATAAQMKAEELSARKEKALDEDAAYMLQTIEDNPEAELAVISRRVRMRLAKEGKALDDGSFPIRNVSDLKNAIRAYGRAKPGKRAKVRRHIVKRARALKRRDLVPGRWREASIDEIPEGDTLTAAAENPCWDGYVMIGMKTVDGKEVPNCVPEDSSEAAVAYNFKGYDDDPEDEHEASVSEFKYFSPEKRKEMAEKGLALPDGSFPIENPRDLRNALWAFKRSDPERREEVKNHITKRAKDLGMEDSLPDIWPGEGSLFSEEDPLVASFRAKIAEREALLAAPDPDLEDLTPEERKAIEEEIKNQDELPERDESGRVKYTAETQPRDARGRFRKVLARLKQDLGTAGLNRVVKKVEEAENLDNAGNYGAAAEAAGDLIGIIDRLDAKALNPEALENVRASSRELGKVIANLPFAFGEEAEKIRFSDIPPALKSLMEDMITRVEAKIGKEDADEATQNLRSFMSGGDYYNQSEISSEMAKLLRLLT